MKAPTALIRAKIYGSGCSQRASFVTMTPTWNSLTMRVMERRGRENTFPPITTPASNEEIMHALMEGHHSLTAASLQARLSANTSTVEVGPFRTGRHDLAKRLLTPSDQAGGPCKGDIWLNDEIINSFLATLQCQAGGSTYCFKTHAYSTLMENGSYCYDGVKRWFRNSRSSPVLLESFQHLLMPIHQNNNHWVLVHINMDTKQIHVYDSLLVERGRSGRAALEVIMANVARLLEKETGEGEWRCMVMDVVGQQLESWECGYFILGNAACVVLSSSTIFTQANVPSARLFILHAILGRSLAPPQ